MKRYLVGLGNWTMGDDSIGLRVVEEVVRRNLDRDFEAVLLPDSGLNLIDYFRDDTGMIIIVDAVRAGKKPGEHFLFHPDDVTTQKSLDGISTHEGDVLKVIQLAKELGYRIPEIVILGIEPENIGVGDLSKTIQQRLDEYVRRILSEV
ncbi:MAG: hydrogenase maturation protease [Pseudomonadota bacterium]